ncbi:MAG: Flp family type IVb pilin [Xanthobacteraceae bacterium]
MFSSVRSARQPIDSCIRHFMRDASGATAIEYALIASGVAVAIASTVFSLGTSVNGLYESVATAMK